MSADNDNPVIDDKIIFACQDAAAEEMCRWMTYAMADGSVQCVRNRESPGDLERRLNAPKNVIELDERKVESLRFKDLDYAKSFISWRGVKAALEHYETLRKK